VLLRHYRVLPPLTLSYSSKINGYFISSEGFFALDKKRRDMFSEGNATPIRSLSRTVCRGQEGPTGSKGTLRPDFQANTRPMILKSQCHHKIQEEIQIYS
jgi:hypothetical protein